MKKIILAFTLILLGVSAFPQKTPTTKPGSTGTVIINVPNFADPATKQFYEAYTSHIKKAVTAVGNKDEAAFIKLAEEGKTLEKKFQYYMSEKKSTTEDIKKKHAWNKQAMPYIQEIIQSDLNKKLEHKEE